MPKVTANDFSDKNLRYFAYQEIVNTDWMIIFVYCSIIGNNYDFDFKSMIAFNIIGFIIIAYYIIKKYRYAIKFLNVKINHKNYKIAFELLCVFIGFAITLIFSSHICIVLFEKGRVVLNPLKFIPMTLISVLLLGPTMIFSRKIINFYKKGLKK